MEKICLGDFDAIQRLLARMIWEKGEKELLIKLLAKRGIPLGDIDDVINANYEKLIDLEPRENIAFILSHADDGLDEDRLYDALRALFIHYLTKYTSNAYMKSLNDTHIDSTTPPEKSALLRSLFGSEHELREFLIGLYPQIVVDIDAFMKNEKGAAERFLEDLIINAGLSDREREFVQFKLENPDARDQDFSQTISNAGISRIKNGAFDKITKFLMTGAGAIQRATRGS